MINLLSKRYDMFCKIQKTLLLLLIGFTVSSSAKDFLLVKDGKPQVSILLPGAKYEKLIESFNEDLQKTTGTLLPVAESEKTPQLRFKINDDTHPLTEDTFTVTFPEKDVIQIECTPVSIQWALNWMLESYAGVRFLFNAICGKSYAPTRTVAIPMKTVKHTPSFPLGREMVLSTPHTRPWFRRKACVNLNHEFWIHAFPADKYFSDNSYPEAIRPVIGGKKMKKIPNKATHWQPCYSNPETARIAIENILEYLKKNRKQHSISLLVNDCGGFCECKECEIANGGNKGLDHSNVYFKWVNKVAEAVCRKYPDLIITSGAYTHTINPPDFKLHKNVCVTLCMDFYAATDPETMERQKKLIRDWSKTAVTLGVWDYCWGYPYLPPRMYYKVHADMLRYLHKHGGRYYFGENENYDAKEGAKVAAIMRLVWDINTDLDKFLNDWYRHAVGEKAAPYLKKYYDFWEAYYAGPATKTLWFASRKATYMSAGDISHIYGLKPGDLAYARSLMEKVVALAGTPGEKERAVHMMRNFEYMEALLKIYGAENVAVDGTIHSAKEAVALLNSIPENFKYITKKDKIAAGLKKEPWLARYYNNRYIGNVLKFEEDGAEALLSQVILAADFVNDPSVKDALKRLSKTPGLPKFLTDTANALRDPGATQNMFTNGGVEDEKLLPNFEIFKGHARSGSGTRSTKYKFNGKYSYKVIPGSYTLVYFREKAEPDTSYILSMKVFVPQNNSEAHMNLVLYPMRGRSNQAYRNLPKIKPSVGVWQTYTLFCKTKKDSDGVAALIFLRNFEGKEDVYFDDIKLIKVGN